ncbi:MAG: hypothetical protein E7198_08845 [Schwartzia succinivorans]|uniref:hypothetical protein n=1 Tax=Schwartzia succinivorans TaxID=55507 RepID=UPI0023560BBA|nr:hypothetical protein [Schwartzia succinivorans]MBE6097887.1 hypothetical protein [Schwartzia succinivorans]
MEKIKMLLGTLPEDDLRKVNEWIENHPDEVPKDAYKLLDKLIFNILWDYKMRAESAPTEEARTLEKKKAELYSKWKELGLVENSD